MTLELLKKWLPAGELIAYQKHLGLSLQQTWFVIAYFALGEPSDQKMSDVTGVPRTSIRDIRNSLKDMGLFSSETGLDAIFSLISDNQAFTLHHNNLPFDSLTEPEKVCVLDQFECRICHKKWLDDGSSGGFCTKKVLEGSSMLATRVLLCNDCVGKQRAPNIVARLDMYIKARRERKNDRIGTFLTELEQRNVEGMRRRSRCDDPVAVSANSLDQNDVSGLPDPSSEMAGAAICDEEKSSEKASLAFLPDGDAQSPPVPPSISLLLEDREKEGANSVDNVSLQGVSHSRSHTLARESARGESLAGANGGSRRIKGIASDDEDEDLPEMVTADKPVPGLTKPSKKMNQKTLLAHKRWEERVERLATTPDDDWDVKDLSVYFSVEFQKAHGYANFKESFAERNRHAEEICVRVGGVSEYKKFIPWMLDKWYTFWWADPMNKPTLRNVMARLSDLIAEYQDHGEAKKLKTAGENRVPDKTARPTEAKEIVAADPRKLSAEEVAQRAREMDEIFARGQKKVFGDDGAE